MPFYLSNDVNPLKPGLKYDDHYKEVVGLVDVIDSNFLKKEEPITSEWLKERMVTKALVSTVTTLVDTSSLPVAVEYHILNTLSIFI